MPWALAFLLFSPGGREALVFLLAFLLFLFLNRRRKKTRALPLAVAATGAFFLAFGLLRILGGEFEPYYLLTNFLLLLLGLSLLRRRPWLQAASLPLAVLLYALCLHEFTLVERTAELTAAWKIGAPGPSAPGGEGTSPGGDSVETRVEFHFGPRGNLYESIYSVELAQYLEKKGAPDALLKIDLLYRWGRLSGTSIEAVDGKQFPWYGGEAGCSFDCDRLPFPEFYLGIRGLH
jgi:hypothetical protein